MFCPNCGQERLSTETSFCSRCGFLLTGAAELLQTGGTIPRTPTSGSSWMSPRGKGVKQGLFIFLLSFLVVPIVTMLTIAIDAEPFGVVISAVLFFVGGLLRMAYALLFESPYTGADATVSNAIPGAQNLFSRQKSHHSLPAQQTFPAQNYASPAGGSWRDTNDLQPSSVTERTTRLLEKDEPSQ